MSKISKKSIADTKLSKKDTLQAVVLADEFTTSLNPVHNVCPTIMMQVANARLLDYLVETLIRSQVQELFLYCSNHIESLKNYVASKRYKDIAVSLIISDGCRSLGDALRDIDTKGLIRGDFILVRGDAFTNANLKDLMTAHRIKCEKDKGAAVTLIFRDLGSTENSSLREQSCMFVADKTNKKVLFHKKLCKDDKRVKLEIKWFLEHDQIEINSGFVDTHIYLCSPSVLPLFADNFDFQTMEDFVRGVLMNDEILGAGIYWQPLRHDEYALPVTSWQAYHALSRDILQRHGYPLTPDILLRDIVYMSRSTYKHRTAVLARGCALKRDTIVGERSVLGKDTSVTRSVIGENCKIGENVKIENSHFLSNVTISDNCIIDSCVMFSNCIIDKNCQLNACILTPGVDLPAKSQYDYSIVDTTSDGKIIATRMSDHDPESCEELLYYKKIRDNGVCEDCTDTEDTTSKTSSLRGSPLPDDTNIFLSEVIDSLLRGYQDKINFDNLILEINSSRYAYNVGIRDVTYNVVKAILVLPLHYLTEEKTTIDNANYHKILRVMIAYFNPIVLKYIRTEDAQEDCLRAIQDVASTTIEVLSFVQPLIHALYDRDILTEDKILEWYDGVVDDEEEMKKEKIRKAVAPFILWLREAEEDSSDDNES